ncbi:DNA polymerase alpha subunit B [Russula earlei]|uniref:DNA polymerase alpha subunit B n=1 Tax=Russula earlei TaxID=71964 RepID=A0ACC0UC45_9AGAM|nr:DNA polymerase alpha subunit B [Russula earlei]
MASGSETTALSEELFKYFGSTPGCDDPFIGECVDLCKTFNFTPENLYYKWESTVLSPSGIGNRYIDRTTPSAIKSAIMPKLNKDAPTQGIKTEFGLRKSRGPQAAMMDLINRRNVNLYHVGLLDTTSTLPSPFATRRNVGKAGTNKIAFESYDGEDVSRNRRNYKYMYEKISERSEALDERIDELADLVRQHYGFPELGDPSASTDEAVIVVGRITLDAEASSGSGKLNEASVHIESSRMMGSGVRVPLKFMPNLKVRGGPKGQANISLFPGAIVALKGRNGGGGWFSVSEFITLPLLPSTSSTFLGDASKQEPRGTSISMTIACGPFTADSDLSFKPWSSLLKSLMSQKPGVVLLIGPFVDSNNEKIKTGDADQTPTELFHTQFTENLHEFLEVSPNSLVLIVPSVRDMTSHHCVYPQSPLDISSLSRDPRIKLLSNPCRFSLNGFTFAVTSMDVLFHLRKEQLVLQVEEVESYDVDGQPTATDTMTSLARHILQQRSFYPLFPTPLDLAHEVNLDVSHLEHLALCHEERASAPDVLIVPSRLKHFSKVVDHTVAVNPSFISKHISANIVFGGSGEGPLSSRIKVDVGKFLE